jgi:PAS domain S-box-containing protein
MTGWPSNKGLRLMNGNAKEANALSPSEARYRLLAENTTDVIMLIAPDFSKRLYVSPACRNVFGCEPEELLREPVGARVHPDDGNAWAEVRARAPDDPENEVTQATHRIIRKDGTAVWVESNRRRLPDNQGYVVSLRDISVRKQAEADLHDAKLRAEQENEARVTFLLGSRS